MTEDKYPSQLAERFQIRLPDGMRDQLREVAETNNRSMNAEIIARLEKSLTSDLDQEILSNWATAFRDHVKAQPDGDMTAAILSLQGGRFMWIDANSETRGHILRSDSSQLLNEAVEALDRFRAEKAGVPLPPINQRTD